MTSVDKGEPIPAAAQSRRRGTIWLVLFVVIIGVAGFAVWRASRPASAATRTGADGGGGGGGGSPAVLLLIAGEVGLSLVGDTLTLPLVIRKKRVDEGYMDKNTSGAGETARPHVLRPFRRRSRRVAGSEKGETARPPLENVSLDKPQPLELPAHPRD